MPTHEQRSEYIEARRYEDETLIERVELANASCQDTGCGMCIAQNDILQIRAETAQLTNDHYARARAALQGGIHGTTNTAMESDEGGLEEGVEPDNGNNEGETTNEGTLTGEEQRAVDAGITVEQVNLADELIRIAARRRDEIRSDPGYDFAAPAIGAVEGADDPVRPTVWDCECDECAENTAQPAGARNNVPLSTSRNDRRTAAAARLP